MSYTTFEAIKIGLASPDMMLAWSNSAISKLASINY